MALEPLQGGQVLFRPTLWPVSMMALLVGHQHDDVRRLRHVDGIAGDGWSDEVTRQAGHSRQSGSHLQQIASRSRLRLRRSTTATGLSADLASAIRGSASAH